jgi:hypothetical protein
MRKRMGKLIYYYLVVFCSVLFLGLLSGCGPALLVGLGAVGTSGYIMGKGVAHGEKPNTEATDAQPQSAPPPAAPTMQ